ncbi:penicillin-binding protein 1B [Solemya pervernicosa gill symbiont]|uniref:Penicillin-binding protein 1B n=1 Tax=Solemya pervernicosa gill symbiont TaxID=642797 RepID=A0A1T2L9C8_9GAMM|nr:penicillin-binding protein 1B [Solemya pervernicosa gill symbiont]
MLRAFLWRAVLIVLLVGGGYTLYLDYTVRQQFDGKRWALPATVYARPMELYVGAPIGAEQFHQELKLLKYRNLANPTATGSYLRKSNRFILTSRPFSFWDGEEPKQQLRISFSDGKVSKLTDGAGRSLDLVRLDPLQIGGIYPSHNEDRLLVQLSEVPRVLQQALIAVEDRNFHNHHGVSPLAILRAAWANLRAGRVVQGGSTLTQQLVKNFYLSSERTLSRKAQEAVMAVLLDAHYEKDEILEAYLNEVYLGQDRSRGVHGFGLAAQFYFEKRVADLKLHETALLVGMVKGPSYYNPHRHPERAKKRRNLVIDLMLQQGMIDARTADWSQRQKLGVRSGRFSGVTQYPAFIGVVRSQLRRDYRDEDLTSEGLRIFTTMDPQLQNEAERVLKSRVEQLEAAKGIDKNKLQGAVVVTGIEGGELLAAVGGRHARYAGFNRALNAVRPIGSLVKPAVYLTALMQKQRYTLATMLEDKKFALKNHDGSLWQPQNYDHKEYGEVPLYGALSRSLNLSTARLGMTVGLDRVAETLERLGVERDIDRFPSMLLGTLALSPLEVTQLYHTLASGGFHTPLRSIRAVLDVNGEALQRYSLQVEAALPPEAIYLTNTILQKVVLEGTARSLSWAMRAKVKAAGKTGTTDDLRDSWFAGFTGNRLAVVWLGRDDNKPAKLSGASGALKVWGDLMGRIDPEPLALTRPDSVGMHWIDPESGLRTQKICPDAVQLPFIRGTEPRSAGPCVGKTLESAVDWIKGVIDGGR